MNTSRTKPDMTHKPDNYNKSRFDPNADFALNMLSLAIAQPTGNRNSLQLTTLNIAHTSTSSREEMN